MTENNAQTPIESAAAPAAPPPSPAPPSPAAESPETAPQTPGPEKLGTVLHTFKRDISSTVEQKNVSLSGIAAAAAAGRTRDAALPSSPRRRAVQITAAAILGIAALAALWYAIRATRTVTTVPVEQNPFAIVFSETSEAFDITERLASDIRSFIAGKVRTASIRIGSVHEIEFDAIGGGEIPTRLRVAAPLFFSTIESTLPEELRRNLGAPFMLGIFSLAKNNAFFILKPSSFEIAFAQMLEWEDDIARDLYPILTGNPATVEIITAAFEDRLIRNRDTRVALDPDGKVRLIYSFIDRGTLVIAPDTETFLEVLSRINTPRPVAR